ncbi:hypothetical protein LBMAG42_32980 [Deltaproteobacteria bacterium]|nr:hypothetical protein LBMAG42_32980 [Deltaproteobacteria bacterium]
MLLPLLLSAAQAGPEDQIMVNSSGNRLHWESMPINYVADPANSEGLEEADTLAAIVAAGGAWTLIEGTDVEFRFRGVERELHGGYDDQNVVFFTDDWVGQAELLAVTSTWSDTSGQILDFDMLVNTADHEWSLTGEPEKSDLQNALTHEFGHALGIDHDKAQEEATMYPSTAAGEIAKRDLADSDVAVLAFMYPDDADGEDAGVSAGAGCSTNPGLPFFAALPAAFLLIRRRKEVPCC